MYKNAIHPRKSLSVSDSAYSVIINFHKKRSVPKEIPSEVEVSVVKMITITRDDCMCQENIRLGVVDASNKFLVISPGSRDTP